jgi:hypothetical protein
MTTLTCYRGRVKGAVTLTARNFQISNDLGAGHCSARRALSGPHRAQSRFSFADEVRQTVKSNRSVQKNSRSANLSDGSLILVAARDARGRVAGANKTDRQSIERGDFCMVESARGHLIDNKHCLGYLERASRRFRLRGAWSSRRGAKDTTCRRSSAARVSIASLGDGSLMVAMFTLHGRWRVRIHSASLGSTVASTLCINAGKRKTAPASSLVSVFHNALASIHVDRIRTIRCGKLPRGIIALHQGNYE